MAQELFLSVPSSAPLNCLRTGEVLSSFEPDYINENGALVFITTIGEEVFISPKFEKLLEDLNVVDSTDVASYRDALDDDYIILNLDSSEGSMISSATYILHYPR